MSVTRRWRRPAGDGRPADPPAAAGSLTPLRSSTGVAVIAATVLASMVGFLDASVVNVAVPAIGRDLGASVSRPAVDADRIPADGRRAAAARRVPWPTTSAGGGS